MGTHTRYKVNMDTLFYSINLKKTLQCNVRPHQNAIDHRVGRKRVPMCRYVRQKESHIVFYHHDDFGYQSCIRWEK